MSILSRDPAVGVVHDPDRGPSCCRFLGGVQTGFHADLKLPGRPREGEEKEVKEVEEEDGEEEEKEEKKMEQKKNNIKER